MNAAEVETVLAPLREFLAAIHDFFWWLTWLKGFGTCLALVVLVMLFAMVFGVVFGYVSRRNSDMRAPLLIFALILPALAHGQNVPDRRGEIVTDSFTYKGVAASAPIPMHMRFRNEAGSNGAGICVVTTGTINGQYQGVPGLEKGRDSLFWQTAKSRPGGHGPDKLGALIEETLPGEKWASYVGRDPSILDKLSRQGYPVASTYTGGIGYNGPIHHDISVIEYRTGGLAAFIDSNDPNHIHWLPAAELARRAVDGGTMWFWWWLRQPGNQVKLVVVILSAALFVGGGFILLTVASALKLEPGDIAHG